MNCVWVETKRGPSPQQDFEEQVSSRVPKGGMHSKQTLVILAILDTVVARLSDAEISVILSHRTSLGLTPESPEALRTFLQTPGSDYDPVGDFNYLISCAPTDQRRQFALVLKLLSHPIGTGLLMGDGLVSWTPFHLMSREKRETALLKVKHSKIPAIRNLFYALTGLAMFVTYGKAFPTLDGRVRNPAWEALGYPGPQTEKPRAPESSIRKPNFMDLSKKASATGRVNLETDVVVVGSGAGGGIVAAELAKEGYSVILLDKATYVHPSDYPLTEMKSFDLFYERKGALVTEDGALRILAGSAWSGGTAINWSASLETPDEVRKEWASRHGLSYFTTPAFQAAIDKVSQVAGIGSAAIKHNPSNQILIDGCQKLGYDAQAIPQNTAGKEHSCGFCTFGCPYGEKQGTMATWIKDAVDNGCQLIDGAWVDRVIHRNGKIVGVWGKLESESRSGAQYSLFIAAKRVVVSCGSIGTPALLLRSGLKNPHIGKHLRLHPVTTVSAVFPDREIKPFSGSIMTAISNVKTDRDGSGYGARLEVPAIHPSMLATLTPWNSAADHKRLFSQFNHTATFIVLTRDRDSVGRVYIDREGNPRIEWSLSAYDAESMLQGLEAGIKIMVAAGARELFTVQSGVSPLLLPRENPLESKELKEFLGQVRSAGIHPLKTGLFCAHQMGSCRLSTSPSRGPVNPQGETWEVSGLFVADASLFPTASGTNPMLTTFSVAYSVAQFLKAEMKEQLMHHQSRL